MVWPLGPRIIAVAPGMVPGLYSMCCAFAATGADSHSSADYATRTGNTHERGCSLVRHLIASRSRESPNALPAMNVAGRVGFVATVRTDVSSAKSRTAQVHLQNPRNAGEEAVMRRRCVSMFLSYVVLGVIAGCGKGPNTEAPQAVNRAAVAVPVEKLAIAAGIQFQNLTIFPVVSNVPRDDDRFITLDEGIRAQTVQVVEVGGIARAGQVTASNADPFGEPLPEDDELPAVIADDPFGDQPGRVNGCPTVNRVLVVNRSEKPLYLMPGETIVGDQQDRTLAEEMLIPPGGKPVEVPVFCVEHGRWAHRSAGQTAMLAARLEFSNNAALVVESFAPLADEVGASGFLPAQDR